ERMLEDEACAVDGDEPGPLGGVKRDPAVAESGCCGGGYSGVLRGVRRRGQQEAVRPLLKGPDAVGGEAPDLTRERQRLRQRRHSRELSVREHRWKLDQRERVAPSMLDQSLDDRWGDLDSRFMRKKGRGGRRVETLEGEGGNASAVEARDVVLAGAEEHHD